MNYADLLEIISCRRIVIIEDDFMENPYKKESFIYDFTRMNLEDREMFLCEVEESDLELFSQLQEYVKIADCAFDTIGVWDDSVPKGDIRPFFSLVKELDSIQAAYDAIDSDLLLSVSDKGLKYGINANHPACFNSLFDEYVLRKNRAKSVRIYQNFSAEIKQQFENDLALASNHESIVCIIDNNLDGTNRAQEILDVIALACQEERKNIVGGIFSSKKLFERIDNALYFEYTSKEDPEKLETCIAKSAYNYFIAKLKEGTLGTLEAAFAHAVSNKATAHYLSSKAQIEGASEYQVIMDWIKLMSTPTSRDNETIKHLISLSRIINCLTDSEDNADMELELYNTFEAFDYTVNDYLLPAMPGDIFMNHHGDIFVLIGQDCDMARRGDGKPAKNTVAEVLPAKLSSQDQLVKVSTNLEKMSISNFKESLETPCKILQIDYKSRRYIANEIINLCAFNDDGFCRISLEKELDTDKHRIMAPHLVRYYTSLQQYHKSANTIKETLADDFKVVIEQAFSPRAVSLEDCVCNEDEICFDLRRICRLTHSYVFYLYRLFLEYRGRQPFQSINLVRKNEIDFPVKHNGQNTSLTMSFVCVLPVGQSPIHKMRWIVKGQEISRVLGMLGVEGDLPDEIILDDAETSLTIENTTLTIIKRRANVEFKTTPQSESIARKRAR